jgi:hypothetical protein
MYCCVFVFCCVCALFVCNVCYLSVLLLYYCHWAEAQLQFKTHTHTHIYIYHFFHHKSQVIRILDRTGQLRVNPVTIRHSRKSAINHHQ